MKSLKTIKRLKYLFIVLLYSSLCTNVTGKEWNIQTKGLVEVALVDSNYQSDWLKNWMDGGVGVLRFNRDDNLQLSQVGLEISADLTSSLTAHVVANGYTDGETKLGITESYLQYAPLSPGLKHELKLGLFYPRMSLENVDTAWNSPFTYSYSAINSWIGEELRTLGAQWTISRNGRRYSSPHSYAATIAAYKANDVLGAILTWRGWALHNRQTRYNETLHFADYFQFGQFDRPLPNYQNINEETDGNWGMYVGFNWRYLKSTDLRIYYYDNMANPLAIEDNNQYAWDTRFTSVAIQHKFSPHFRVLGQWLQGKTDMGTPTQGVMADFAAWYLMASYKTGSHRLTARFDRFSVTETDQNPDDPNDSSGHSVTLAWRHNYSAAWQLGIEWIGLTSRNENRTLWSNWTAANTQHQFMAVAQWRF